MRFLQKIIESLLLLFVFLLPWQAKLILRPEINNFNEIGLYLSHLVLLLALIFFFIYQLKKRSYLYRTPIIWYFLGGLEISILISFFVAPDKILAAYHYFLMLGGLGLFYLVREGINRGAYEESCLNRIRIIYTFLISIFFQSVLGIYQFLSQKSLVSKFLGLANHDPQVLGTSVIETASGRWLRAYGGLDHPNILGGVLVIALLLSAFLLARKRIINSQIQMGGVLLLFCSYFFSLAALFFTFSRTAWLASVIGFVVLLLSILKEEDHWVLKRLLGIIFFSLILFSLAFLPYKELIMTRFRAETRLEQISLNERTDFSDEAIEIIKKNTWLGIGAGNYVKQKEIVKTDATPYEQPVHNAFLLIFAESGIFAFLSLILFLVFLTKNGRRQNFSLAIIVSIVILMLFDHWLMSLPFGVLFFFLILGVI